MPDWMYLAAFVALASILIWLDRHYG